MLNLVSRKLRVQPDGISSEHPFAVQKLDCGFFRASLGYLILTPAEPVGDVFWGKLPVLCQ